ncbi:MAG TPA: hypothetical protein VN736_28735 [Candidatus Limnocylindrales bacterium]|nr:hypothetical protein [Candidatus Limnocylindrales bacterium]
MPVMGLREYSRHRGCSLAAVQKAIASGRIRKTEDSRIDSEEADKAWAANSDPAKQRQEAAAPVPPPPPLLNPEVLPPAASPALVSTDATTGGPRAPLALTPLSAPGTNGRPPAPDWDGWPVPPPRNEQWPSAGGEVIDGESFAEARRRMAWITTWREQAKWEQERGLSIRTDEARKSYREIGRICASVRKQAPSQIAQAVAGLTDVKEIEMRVSQILRQHDERIIREIEAQQKALVESVECSSGTGS